jgi:hypothetical protein
MRKRISKRRWKRRALLGMAIPRYAILLHRLDVWREWNLCSGNAEVYRLDEI